MLADVFTTNPLSGEIDAVNEPLFNIGVSNAKLAILIFLNPLPSPINDDPEDAIIFPPVMNNPPLTLKLPDTNVRVPISNPLFSDITASTEPDCILSILRSSNASGGMLNNPLPSPSYLAAVIGTFTSNLVGSIIAKPEPELILDNSKFSIASGGMLNNPPPSPMNSDAVIEPLIATDDVN